MAAEFELSVMVAEFQVLSLINGQRTTSSTTDDDL
jgi:hypothetical protein